MAQCRLLPCVCLIPMTNQQERRSTQTCPNMTSSGGSTNTTTGSISATKDFSVTVAHEGCTTYCCLILLLVWVYHGIINTTTHLRLHLVHIPGESHNASILAPLPCFCAWSSCPILMVEKSDPCFLWLRCFPGVCVGGREAAALGSKLLCSNLSDSVIVPSFIISAFIVPFWVPETISW